MKKIMNIISPVLKEYRYRNKPDPFLEFKKLRKNEVLPDEDNGNVLLLPIRMAPISNLFEGIYGYAMKLRGYSVHSLFCNQAINKCENIHGSKLADIQCSLCNYEQKRFSNTFGINYHSYFDIIDKKLIKKIKKISQEISLENIFDFMYDDVFLGIHIKSATMRYLLSSSVDKIKDEYLIREFIFSTIISYETAKKLILKLNPKFVLSSHGVYSTWGGALEACKKLNVHVVIWGRGYVGGNILASHNESYLSERVTEPVSYWENIELTDKQKEKIKNYFLHKRKRDAKIDFVNYYNNIEESTKSIYELLNLRKDSVKFGLFPNIPWDGTSFSYSNAFPDMLIFLKTTINWFVKHPECDLIIRAHPAEMKTGAKESVKDLIDSIFLTLPNNVYYLGSDHTISSYEVEEISEASLLYAGTIALELANFGKPCIQTGSTNSTNKGFIFEPKSINEYENFLEKVSQKELFMTEEMKERAMKFAYHWIYKRHIPENTYERNGLQFKKYNLESSMDLALGKNKFVDFFIDRCEDGKPFIWEE